MKYTINLKSFEISFCLIFSMLLPFGNSFGQSGTNPNEERSYYAILFATNEYNEWQNLENPVNDAKTIATELEDHYGFTVEVMQNEPRQGVINKLKELKNHTFNQYDQLLIYFAGHGYFDEELNQGYLVCADSRNEDNDKSSYISPEVLANTIDEIPSLHTLVIIDVCRGSIADKSEQIARRRSTGLDNAGREEFIQFLLKNKTRKYLTSGSTAYLKGEPGMHSPFSRQLIEELRMYGGQDGLLQLSELIRGMGLLKVKPYIGAFGSDESGSNFVLEAKK